MLQKMILNADGSELEDISILLSGRHAILKTFLSKKCGHTVFQLSISGMQYHAANLELPNDDDAI
uniref:Uncharacterized protein n=1 Tax=Moniliophthora roreri TaxID=221103 RepID=A0A0W0ETT8_MONRR